MGGKEKKCYGRRRRRKRGEKEKREEREEGEKEKKRKRWEKEREGFDNKSNIEIFELVSGLRINFHRNQAGSIGISQLDKLVYSKCLNC